MCENHPRQYVTETKSLRKYLQMFLEYILSAFAKYKLNIDPCKRCRNYSIETLEPVIIHHSNQKADLLYVFWRDIKHNGLIIDWIQSVPLC